MADKFGNPFAKMLQVPDTLAKATEAMPTWDPKDQFLFMMSLAELAELADKIMAKYDGRNERMRDFMDIMGNIAECDTEDE